MVEYDDNKIIFDNDKYIDGNKIIFDNDKYIDGNSFNDNDSVSRNVFSPINSLCYPIGKNFFDDSHYILYHSSFLDHVILFPAVDSNQTILFNDISFLPSSFYTFSFDAISTGDTYLYFDVQPDSAAPNSNYDFYDTRFLISSTLHRYYVSGILSDSVTGFRFFRPSYSINTESTSIEISNIQLELGSSPTSYEEYEGCLYGLDLYDTIESNFITDNYFINCGVISIFLFLIILIVNAPFIFIRKVRGN